MRGCSTSSGGSSIRSPRITRCLQTYHVQRTRLELIADPKVRRRQFTDDANVEITRSRSPETGARPHQQAPRIVYQSIIGPKAKLDGVEFHPFEPQFVSNPATLTNSAAQKPPYRFREIPNSAVAVAEKPSDAAHARPTDSSS
jgi:hypothetical protein